MKRLFGFRLFSNDFGSTYKLQYLRGLIQRLESIAEDVRTQVRNEEIQASKKQRSEVSLWLEEVDSMKEKFQIIEKGGRSGVGKKLQRMVETAENLVKQGEFPRGLVLDDFNPEGLQLVTQKLEGSTPSDVQGEVWGCFERGEVRVGLYGMGGVGKTSVAMHINNKILSENDMIFHGVFYVTVSRDTNVYKLQNDIAKAFGLSKLMYEDEPKRAAELRQKVTKREGFLLILDDVWESISMEAVGVCVEGDGCKLLITTRRKDVCHKMSCFPVKINPLSEKDSWELFKKQLGNYEELSGEVNQIARLVAKECDGLPLGIITMAGCMRGEHSAHMWRDALRTLQDPSSSQHDPDMEDDVFKMLRFSYDRLKDEKLQKCFLYCALYPEDHKIEREELIRQFIAEGLLDGSRREEKIDRGHTLLNALENASLLESVIDRDRRCIKMHDLVRDMAIKILGLGGLVKGGNSLKEVPGELQCFNENLEWVSLMDNHIKEIEDMTSPNCPNVSVVLLQDNYLLKFISESFFVHMIGLKVLNLSGTIIGKLPDCVSNLVNLKALLLSDCEWLNYIPPIRRLTKLRELVLEQCRRLKQLPEGMEELVCLELLNVGGIGIQGTLNGSFIVKLRNLDSFSSNFHIMVQPSELLNLRNLTRLSGVLLSDADLVNGCVDLGGLNRFKTYSVFVASYYSDFMDELLGDRRIRRHVERKLWVGGCELSAGKKVRFQVPENVQFLGFYECKFGGRSLVDDVPSLCRTSELKELEIESCSGIEYIISEDVHLCISFASLRRLDIIECENVKKLWALNIGLPNLEEITIERCGEMEEIFVTEQGAAAELPRLNYMSVSDLPELRSICDNCVFCPRLATLNVRRCPKVKKLALWSHNLPSLKDLYVTAAAIQLPNLRKLSLLELPQLRSICRNTLVCNSLQVVELDYQSSCKLENFPISIPRLTTTDSNSENHYSAPKFIAWDVSTSLWLSLNWNDLNTKSILHELGCFTYKQDPFYIQQVLPFDLNILPQGGSSHTDYLIIQQIFQVKDETLPLHQNMMPQSVSSPTNHTHSLHCNLDLHL